MAMTMLVAGGMLPGNAAEPPYEGEPAALVGRDLSGTCVKLLHGGRMGEIPAGPTPVWRFVWLDRNPVEQGKSMVKFLTAMAGITPRPGAAIGLARTFEQDRPSVLGALRRVGPVLILDYERVLAQPRKAARLLRRWVWPALDVEAAAAVVHQRDGLCRPDLAVELSLRGGDR